MTSFDTRHSPDYSTLLVHFTADQNRAMMMESLITDEHPLLGQKTEGAYSRLLNILRTKQLFATPMPHIPHNHEAVCFSECIWDSLLTLTARYSNYGVVFTKRYIFDKGGGPALYVRGDQMKSEWADIPEALEAMISPFDPRASTRRRPT